ncbi:MAG: tetratricopeptide repeat protein [Muribaculaceae bacterium]|nr:tetratricopeptide repeat protein [Muribaculaceae bacterium]
MTTQSQQNYNKINKLINSSRINESFLLLKNQMKNYPTLQKELDKLRKEETTYKYMLDYISEGHNDPSQLEMLEQIRDNLYRANELLLRENILKDSSDIYSSTRRMFKLRETTLESLLNDYNGAVEEIFKGKKEESQSIITQTQAKYLSEIFNYVWTMFGCENAEYETLSNVLDSNEYPEYLKSILISAIVLGNLTYFDPDSFEILLNLYENTDSVPLKARAMVGIVLISLLNSKRLKGNLRLRSRLILSGEDESLKKLVNEVLINIIRTYDTKRIDNKMRNEVIPGLMKINPEIINKMRDLASDSENFLSEGNPEWEDIIEESGVADKLKEISDLQLEGADVMVTAFSNLKGFPFFSQPSNWFLPFTPGYYEFASMPFDKDEENMKRLTSVMCDSDLHSFFLSMGTMPEDKRNLMISNLQNQMKQAYEAMSDAVGETESQRLSKKIRHNLQDIYRFFKFYRKRNDFSDPFEKPFVANDIENLMSVYDISPDNIKWIAEFYFKNKYYAEAAGLYELLDNIEPGNSNVWEKIGYSKERLSQFDKAVEWYKKSEILNPENQWLIKRLAISLKNSEKPEEAIEYYEKALSSEPENYHLLMSAGQCLLSGERYGDALQKFYHAQYLRPDKADAQRAVAWAELLSKNYEKARMLYEKILEDKNSDKTDYLNAAHGALASGDFKSALQLYKDFVAKTENQDITSLVIAFRDDADIIKQLGIKTQDLRFIVDKIRYDLTGE